MKHKPCKLVPALFLALAVAAGAQEVATQDKATLDVEIGVEGKVASAPLNLLSTRESLVASLETPLGLWIRGDLIMSNDGKYEAELASVPGGKFFGNYMVMREGGLGFRSGTLSLTAGRLRHFDEVDSPYSLFVNSLGHSGNIMELRYQDSLFTYQSRWVELNHNSAYQSAAWVSGFPDRGANIKTYALDLGTLRLGFQDAAVYTGETGSGRNFDLEYFLNPLPQYFIQYIKGTGGRPWTTGTNENNMIGLFAQWDNEEGTRWYVQTLLDDFNVHFLFPQTPDFPYKAAWALGAEFDLAQGTLGLHHAGSPMYSFAPITSTSTTDQWQTAYGYTYYPETRYTVDGGVQKAIGIEDNMLGYLHGENNVAFRADWAQDLAGTDLAAFAELVVAGSSSPANPWHDGVNHPMGTRMLDEAVLETTLRGSVYAARSWGSWTLSGTLDLGYRWNERGLRAPTTSGSSDVDDEVWIWQPVAGADRWLGNVTLGVSYGFGLGD